MQTMEDQSILNSQLPTTRRRVLVSLKENGASTVDQLSAQLDITTVAVRRHLVNLERDHLVQHHEAKQTVGRPSFVYELTEAGHTLFPKRYDKLATQILESVDEIFGAEAIDKIFQHSLSRQMESYRPYLDGKTLKERVQQLALLREAEGYMATWEQIDDNTFLLRQHNCPILKVAQWCRATCAEATSTLGQLLDAEVTRQSHQVDGDASCTFLVHTS